jgi:glutathione peroxidase
MKKIKYLFLKIFGNKNIQSKPANFKSMSSKSFYDLKLNSIEGREIDFSIYKNKKVLIVNTASECGFTPQYNELEELHQTYGNKIIVIGFPSNNFGGQEQKSNEEIAAFCIKNFGVTFQLFEKSDVIGEHQNVLYHWLTHKEENGWNDESPKWNFCKYLINENGELINYFSSAVNPMSSDILNLL